MLKKLISFGLATAAILSSLGTVSYAQQAPIVTRSERNIPPTQIEAEVPSMITEGFDALCSAQAKNPFPIWAEHAIPILRDAMKSPETTGAINQMFEGMLGKCIGYSVIASNKLTERTQIVYVESDHEQAPLFWRFTVYRSPDSLVISSFEGKTEASEIIPLNMLIGH